MEENAASRQVAALKAIVQTVIPDLYSSRKERRDQECFFEMVRDDDPVSMAIANALTEDEIAAAFSWGDGTDESVESEFRTTPVTPFLTEEQRERARVMRVAEHEADKARVFALDPAGTGSDGAPDAERGVKPYEEAFVAAMAKDLVEQRSGDALDGSEGSVEERIESFPEPWRSRTRKELGRLREDIAGMLEGKAQRAPRTASPPGG